MVGKVLQKIVSTFEIEYWKGTINKEWVPWLTNNGEPWVDVLPKECIYLAAFELDNEFKRLNKAVERAYDTFLDEGNEGIQTS